MMSAIAPSVAIAAVFVSLIVVGIGIDEFTRRKSRKAQLEQIKTLSQQKK